MYYNLWITSSYFIAVYWANKLVNRLIIIDLAHKLTSLLNFSKFWVKLSISENLESLERGELKFSCSYDESDNFGDSCGSAEEVSEEGSDSEQDEVETGGTTQYEYIQVKEEDIEDVDVEVSVKCCENSTIFAFVFFGWL